MANSIGLMTRALELARSGTIPDLVQLRMQLRQERFESVDHYITGSLSKQLRAAIDAARLKGDR